MAVGLAVAVSFAFQADAWGATGHDIVGALALKHLSPVAAAEANRLLGAHFPKHVKVGTCDT